MPEYAKDQPIGFKNAIERVAIVGVRKSISYDHVYSNTDKDT